MRYKTALSLFAVVVLVAACQTNSGRAIKMQQSSGKMTRGSDAGYRAVCKTQTPGGHEGTWTGPFWSAKEQAMRDAADHNNQFPGHNATVEH